MQRSFYFFGHQGKEKLLIEALRRAHWKQVHVPRLAQVIFSDVDVSSQSLVLKKLHEQGKVIMIYPHAAMPNLFGDIDGYTAYDKTYVQFVPARGYIDIMRAWGYAAPLEVMGWHLCPILPFRPRSEVRKVLFAPIHPNADGTLSNMGKEINGKAFFKLLTLVEAGAIDLTVRYLRGIDANGLWHAPNVQFIEGKPNQSIAEIDAADLVVAGHQTMGYMAVARGVPAVFMGEEYPPRSGSEAKGDFRKVKSWDKYKSLMMFPHDILCDADTLNLFRAVAAGDPYTAEWRRRMIGESFDAGKFVGMVERYLR